MPHRDFWNVRLRLRKSFLRKVWKNSEQSLNSLKLCWI